MRQTCSPFTLEKKLAIEAVTTFKYLGSITEASGDIKMKVEDRIAYALRAFEIRTSL